MSPTLIEVFSWTGTLCIAISIWALFAKRLQYWLWSLASNAFLGTIFLAVGLPIAAGLQLAYALFAIYGIIRWARESRGQQISGSFDNTGTILACFIFVFSLYAASFTDAWTILEAGAVAVAIVANWLTCKKIVWCWPLWVITNIGFAVLFAHQGLWVLFASQWLFAAMSVWGWREWVLDDREPVGEILHAV